MRKIYYSVFSFFIAVNLSAQAPGGVSGSVLWLKGNAGASTTNWYDNTLFANDFAAPAGHEPVLTTNVFNYNTALTFNGGSYLTKLNPTSFPTGVTDRSVFVVGNTSDNTTYRWIFAYGEFGTPNSTFQVGNGFGGLYNAYYGSDIHTDNYWSAPVNANGTLAEYTLAGGVQSQYDRGLILGAAQPLLSTLTAASENAVIGAADPSGVEPWIGNIGEVITFNTALSDADRNKVESYLALKYGFTLGTGTATNYVASDNTIFWNGTPAFQHDVFGIGKDNGSLLTQVQSNSMNAGNEDGTGQPGKGNLMLFSTTPLTDKQFLMIGNDAGTLNENTIAPGNDAPMAQGSQRVGRNWKIQNTGAVGAVNLSIDMNGLSFTGGSTPTNYRLMIDGDNDGNYSTGTASFVMPSSITGSQINFTGVSFTSGAAFTLITQASALLPAIWEGFTASLDKNKATLVWKTSSEINVDHYTAEYSTNGQTFSTAGSVTAKNTAGTNTYTLSQDNLPAGIRYYRIKRVDKDGRFELSEVKSVRIGGSNTVQLKANPVTMARLELNIDVQQNQDAIIRVITTDGKILLLQHQGLLTGSNSVSTSIAGLASGTYYLQVKLGTQIINKKFIRL